MSATKKQNAATVEKLSRLHERLAEVLLDSMDGLDGPVPAQVLNVARQFLRDNHIEAEAAPGSKLAALKDRVPFGDDDSPPTNFN